MASEIIEDKMKILKEFGLEVLDLYDEKEKLLRKISSQMVAISPNLATLVKELARAQLISKVSSLINLAKRSPSIEPISGEMFSSSPLIDINMFHIYY